VSKALKYGKAGPVQAIENSKTIVQTLEAIIILGQIPSFIQWMAIASGLVGIVIII